MKIVAHIKKKIHRFYLIKFTNIKYYIGGGKCPLRIRKNQNYTLHYGIYPPPKLNDNEWKDHLYYLTKGKITITSSTKVIRKCKYY